MFKESGLLNLKDINVYLVGKFMYNGIIKKFLMYLRVSLCTITKFMNIIPEHRLTYMCRQMTLIYVKLVLGIRE